MTEKDITNESIVIDATDEIDEIDETSELLSFVQSSLLTKKKSILLAQHTYFLSQNPVLKPLLHDFLSKILLEAPEDVFEFSKSYWSLKRETLSSVMNLDNE